MQIIRGLAHLTPLAGSAITIGNFDGVHLAHQAIIRRLVAKARDLNLPSVLISFAPTPRDFFQNPQATLSNFRQKHQLLSALKLDKHLIIRFDEQFSKLSAQDFISQILTKKLGAKYVLVGDDFRFGAQRLGDFKLLQRADFAVENLNSILIGSKRISSTTIRAQLTQGKFAEVAQLLGREFSISGRIVRGQQRGRTIDFPTLNIPIKAKISPVLGVFAVRVKLGKSVYNGVCNIGTRPTVGGKRCVLEVFLFDFNRDIYGQFAQIIFKHKIRDEQKFATFEDLKNQIQQDVKSAKTLLNL